MSVANANNFQPDQPVWLNIDDEAIAARFVEYKTCERGHLWCVCTYSDLVLKGRVNAGPEITFATRQACVDSIDARNRELSAT